MDSDYRLPKIRNFLQFTHHLYEQASIYVAFRFPRSFVRGSTHLRRYTDILLSRHSSPLQCLSLFDAALWSFESIPRSVARIAVTATPCTHVRNTVPYSGRAMALEPSYCSLVCYITRASCMQLKGFLLSPNLPHTKVACALTWTAIVYTCIILVGMIDLRRVCVNYNFDIKPILIKHSDSL